MKTYIIDAEEEIISVATTINTDVKSWNDWTALHIESSDDISEMDFEDASLSVKAIIESYLTDIEGNAYFCNDRDIYVICKNTHNEILEQAGIQICDLAFKELSLKAQYRLYNLGTDGREFSKKIYNDIGKKFSINISSNDDAVSEQDNQDISHKEYNNDSRVLLVEDDAVTRWLVRDSLKGICELATARSASSAFSLYSSFKPDIVLLDIGLPDNSGNEVLEWIMRNDPNACVVMLSGKSDIENISGCIEKGAKGFIPKPFVKDNLLYYIRTYARTAA